MDLTYQQVQNDPVIDYTDGQKAPSLETDSSITIRNNKKELVFIDLKQPFDHVYRPGEKLHGKPPKKLTCTRIKIICRKHQGRSNLAINHQESSASHKDRYSFSLFVSFITKQ
jgi:hypothetical protein